MYETEIPNITVRSIEERQLDALERIEKLLENQLNGLRHIAQLLSGTGQKAAAEEAPKRGKGR